MNSKSSAKPAGTSATCGQTPSAPPESRSDHRENSVEKLMREVELKRGCSGEGRSAGLTPRQKDVLTCIANYRYQHGISPIFQEMADLLGVSKVVIFEHVSELERKGIIRRDKFKARSIVIAPEWMPRRESSLKFPIVGTISRKGVVTK